MEFKILFLLVVTIVCLVQHVTASNEALLECARVHEIDNIANLSTAIASFSNSQCMLVCVVGSAILPVESIHEGHNCPEDTNGICRNGQCIGGQEDALRECGLKHHLDFNKVDNHQGTAFTNDQCTLKCVLGGIELPVNHLHQGLPCPANPNGVCRSGTCVTQSTNQGSTVTPIPPTIPPPTTVTQPSIDSFFPSKMKLLDISLESTDPALKHDQSIYLYFHETIQSNGHDICHFYGSPTAPDHCDLQAINDIPSKLNKASQLLFELNDSNSFLLTAQYEDFYPPFVSFYENRKLAFEEKENFIANFLIHRDVSPHDKVIDVELGFTIGFSKD